MLTPEATETPIPLTGEVRPKIGPTAQTGTRAASDDAGRAGLAQRLRKGTRQCGHSYCGSQDQAIQAAHSEFPLSDIPQIDV